MSAPLDSAPGRTGRMRGFTLLEVMVALAVVAIALTAVLSSSGRTVRNAAELRDRTIAQWVAENRLAELRLESGWPSTGRTRGQAEMAGRDWFWTMRVAETEDEDLRRVEVEVARDRADDDGVFTMLGFVGRPQQVQALPGFVPSVIPGPGEGDEDDPPPESPDPPSPPGAGPR